MELSIQDDRELSPTEKSELEQHEAVIEKGVRTFMEVGAALLTIRDQRLYRAGFDTFEAYCRDRWGMSRVHAHRVIEAAQVTADLLPIGNIPANEAQVRPLVALPPAQRQEAWSKAVESAPNGKPTARDVQEAVQAIRGVSAPRVDMTRIVIQQPADDQDDEPDETTEATPVHQGNGHANGHTNGTVFELIPPAETDVDKAAEAWDGILNTVNHFIASLKRRGGVSKLTQGWRKERIRVCAGSCKDLREAFAQLEQEFRGQLR